MAKPKKFLLVTYYWPPSGGGGVMRWLKMSKYIGEAGWHPIVYAPLDGEIAVEDPSLAAEVPDSVHVIRRPIWEPYKLYKSFVGRKKQDKVYSGFINERKKASLTHRISVWVRGNLFIPDARMFWIRPSARYLIRYLKEHPVDALVTTGPPHSMHLIGLRVHRATGIPWIADFRDPWTNIDFYKDLKLTRWADARHHRLEKIVMTEATLLSTVTWGCRDEFQGITGRDDIEIITNGFDDADYPEDGSRQLDPEFTIVHFGSMNKDRDPHAFWKAVRAALSEEPALDPHLRIRLIGPTDFSVRDSVARHGLEGYVEYVDFVPHAAVVRQQQRAQVLLAVINDTPSSRLIVPGKLYEYLGSRRPIIAIAPTDSDSATVLRATGAGTVHAFDDVDGLTRRILECFKAYQAGALGVDSRAIEPFTRRNLAHRFARLLDRVTGHI